ncbi:MAG: hypothetical protein WCT04_18855 [Planctomycetota bacterium]
MRRIKLLHRFLKTEAFKIEAERLQAWEQVDQLKPRLDRDPLLGDVIPGGGGLRKIRIGLPGRGKRSGARVIYFQMVSDTVILLLGIYAKNELSDLSSHMLDDLKTLRDIAVNEYRRRSHGEKLQ